MSTNLKRLGTVETTEAIEPTDEIMDLIRATPETEAQEEQPEIETTEVEAEAEQSDDAEAEAETDDADAPPEKEQPERYTVKVDGEPVKVTLDELKRGYAGQAYIQQRMQAVAEEARALTSEREALLAFAENLQKQGAILPEPTPPDPSLVKSNPIAYMESQAKYLQDMAAFQRQQEQLYDIASKRDMAAKQSDAEAEAACERELLKAVPDLADPEKAKPLMDAIRKGALAYGYTLDDLRSTRDPRAFLMALDAGRYRALQSRKAEVTAKVAQPAQRSLKPSGATASGMTSGQYLEKGLSGDDEAWTRYLRS